MSGRGGQVLIRKWGRVPDGGIDQIFVKWGGPPAPPGAEKNPGSVLKMSILKIV